MSAGTQLYEDVCTYLRTLDLEEGTTVVDADPGATPPAGPIIWPTPTLWTPTSRAVAGNARTARDMSRIVCVAASSRGASNLAWDVAAALDGVRLGDAMVQVTLTTAAREDKTDPSLYRWSATVDVARSVPRTSI